MPIAKVDTNDPNICFYIEGITIIPNISAGLYYKKIIQGAGGSDHQDILEGDEYRRWSNDDRYIYIYIFVINTISNILSELNQSILNEITVCLMMMAHLETLKRW